MLALEIAVCKNGFFCNLLPEQKVCYTSSIQLLSFSALLLVLWRLGNSITDEILEDQRSLRKFSKNENNDEDVENGGESILLTHNWKWINQGKDVELVCCEILSIISQGKTKEMYPFILGDYKQIKENPKGFLKIGQPKMFLMQPETPGYTWAYTWGVTRSLEARWGYIRSARAKPSPTWAGGWMVFDKNTRTFVVDETLQVECSVSF